MTDHPMMTCGHAANAVMTQWKGETFDPPTPCCVICSCVEIAATEPDLTGRLAKCCSREPVPSSLDLAFFEHRPTAEFDHYYCGHAGWD